MTLAEAKRVIARVWESGQTGRPADTAKAADLAELVDRGMLETWTSDTGEWFKVTELGKKFIGARTK